MPRQVKTPDGRVHQFPDAATDDEISDALAGIYQRETPPAESPSPAPRGMFSRSTLEDFPVVDLAKGAASSMGSMVFRGGDLIRRGLGMERVIDRPEVQSAITAPDSVAGKIGRFAGDASVIGRGMGIASQASAGFPLVGRMAAQGGALATMAAAQGGDPISAGVVGAAIPAAGAALSHVPEWLKHSAVKKVSQALGAQKERFKAIAERRAPEIVSRGLAGSRPALLKTATEQAREAGQVVDDVLVRSGATRVPTQPIMEALEQAKAAYTVPNAMPIAKAFQTGAINQPGARIVGKTVEVPIQLDARPIQQLSKLQDTIREFGDDVSVDHLVALRRVWDDVVARTGGFAHRRGSQFGVPLAEQTEAWAKREATKSIRQELAKAVPDLQSVNREFAFWKDLQDVLTATQARTQAQGAGLGNVVRTAAGAGAGFSSGNSWDERAKNAAFGALVGRAISLPATTKWQLVSARLRNKLADALASGSYGQIMGALTQIGAVQGGKALASPAAATATTPPQSRPE